MVFTGDETVAEAAGGAVEDLLSGTKAKAPSNAEGRDRGKQTAATKEKGTRKPTAGRIDAAAKKKVKTTIKKISRRKKSHGK
jgi:hypothetical protein